MASGQGPDMRMSMCKYQNFDAVNLAEISLDVVQYAPKKDFCISI
jgi:hypothetical protein